MSNSRADKGTVNYQFTVLTLYSQEVHFALALFDYFTKEASLLSFPGGAVIKIIPKEGVDEGR